MCCKIKYYFKEKTSNDYQKKIISIELVLNFHTCESFKLKNIANQSSVKSEINQQLKYIYHETSLL